MSLEERIIVKADLEAKESRRRSRKEVAKKLSDRFDFDAEKIESELIDTKYTDVFGTGSVYWHYSYGHLYWYTRPDSSRAHSTYGRGLDKLVKRLERKR